MISIKEWKKKSSKEKEKNAPIYEKCVERGCERHILERFTARALSYPFKQTKAFMDLMKKDSFASNIENHLNQWKIYLEVMLEEQPQHEKASEWEKSLKLLK